MAKKSIFTQLFTQVFLLCSFIIFSIVLFSDFSNTELLKAIPHGNVNHTQVFLNDYEDNHPSVADHHQHHKIPEHHIANEAELLQYVEKLNAHIDEQTFLLRKCNNVSNDNNTSNNNNKMLDTILESLKDIEQEAQKNDVLALIDYPQIEELRGKISLCKQAKA